MPGFGEGCLVGGGTFATIAGNRVCAKAKIGSSENEQAV